jgi:hypothetical protein
MKIETTLENLLFSTVKIETVYKNGTGSGTGFFFMHEFEGQSWPFIVTNRHVVEGGLAGNLMFTKESNGQPLIGNGFKLDVSPSFWADMWFDHPDKSVDIAVAPLVPLVDFVKRQHSTDLFLRFIETKNIPTQAQLETLNILESVTFVGYPNGLWDAKNLTPIMRKGTTATPIQLDFEGEPKFLIDASVFGGSSGSPVFIADTGAFATRDGSTNIGSRLHFIGVIAAVYQKTDRNAVVPIPIPTGFQAGVETNQMIDLGIVFKAHTVTDAIEAFIAAKAR